MYERKTQRLRDLVINNKNMWGQGDPDKQVSLKRKTYVGEAILAPHWS